MAERGRLPDFVSDVRDPDQRVFSDHEQRRILRERGLTQAERARNMLISAVVGLLLLAVAAFGLLRIYLKSTGHLIRSLSSRDANVRAYAALRLIGREQEAERIVAALEPCLNDADTAVRRAALFTLLWYSDQAERLASAFGGLLDDPDEQVRNLAGFNLRSIPDGVPRREAVKAVIASGHRATPPFSPSAELVLRMIGGRNKSAYPHLVELVRNNAAQYNARRGAADALHRMAGNAPDLAPDIAALADELAAADPDLAERMRHSADSASKLSSEQRSAIIESLLPEIVRKAQSGRH